MTEPVSPTPDAPTDVSDTPAAPTKRSLEDSLSGLDDATKAFVLGQVQKARTEASNLRDRLKDAEPKLTEYEQMVNANKTEAQRLADEATRWQTEAQTWRTAAVGSRIEALAAAEFADPSDAASALADKLSGYLDAGGQINEAAIKADLADVLTRKPHWRKQDGSPAAPRVPAPNPVQGSGGGRPVADPAAEFASLIQGQLRS